MKTRLLLLLLTVAVISKIMIAPPKRKSSSNSSFVTQSLPTLPIHVQNQIIRETHLAEHPIILFLLNTAFNNQHIITEQFNPIPLNRIKDIDEEDIISAQNITVSSHNNGQITIQYKVYQPITIQTDPHGLFSISADGRYILIANRMNKTITVYNVHGIALHTYQLPQNFHISAMAMQNNQLIVQGIQTNHGLNKQYTFNFNLALLEEINQFISLGNLFSVDDYLILSLLAEALQERRYASLTSAQRAHLQSMLQNYPLITPLLMQGVMETTPGSTPSEPATPTYEFRTPKKQRRR